MHEMTMNIHDVTVVDVISRDFTVSSGAVVTVVDYVFRLKNGVTFTVAAFKTPKETSHA